MPRKIQPPLFVKIPRAVDLENLLNEYPLEIANARDYLIAILSLMKINGEYTVIRSTRLKRLADNYRGLVTWLKDRSILKIDEEYSIKNRIAKRYKLTDAYLNSVKSVPIYRAPIINKLKDHQKIKDFIDGYKYQAPNWIALKELALLLKLKPKKILKGLKIIGFVSETISDEDKLDTSNKGYYYQKVVVGRYRTYKILIDSNCLDYIKALSEQYPQHFPRSLD